VSSEAAGGCGGDEGSVLPKVEGAAEGLEGAGARECEEAHMANAACVRVHLQCIRSIQYIEHIKHIEYIEYIKHIEYIEYINYVK
jgi:hypothetical protein